jgi:hypothetical protein
VIFLCARRRKTSLGTQFFSFGLYFVFVEPRHEPIDIHKISIKTVQMHNVGLFSFNDIYKLIRGKMAAAVHNTGKASKQVIKF